MHNSTHTFQSASIFSHLLCIKYANSRKYARYLKPCLDFFSLSELPWINSLFLNFFSFCFCMVLRFCHKVTNKAIIVMSKLFKHKMPETHKNENMLGVDAIAICILLKTRYCFIISLNAIWSKGM